VLLNCFCFGLLCIWQFPSIRPWGADIQKGDLTEFFFFCVTSLRSLYMSYVFPEFYSMTFNENWTCNILSRITSEPQGQTLRSRRRNYVRIRDRRMLMRWLWRSWFWPWFLCATPTLDSKKKSEIPTSGKLLARSLNPTANWELDNGNSCCVCA